MNAAPKGGLKSVILMIFAAIVVLAAVAYYAHGILDSQSALPSLTPPPLATAASTAAPQLQGSPLGSQAIRSARAVASTAATQTGQANAAMGSATPAVAPMKPVTAAHATPKPRPSVAHRRSVKVRPSTTGGAGVVEQLYVKGQISLGRDPFASNPFLPEDGASVRQPSVVPTLPPVVGAPGVVGSLPAGIDTSGTTVLDVVMGPNPVALVSSGGATQILQVGDSLLGSRVKTIDINGVTLADKTRLDLAPNSVSGAGAQGSTGIAVPGLMPAVDPQVQVLSRPIPAPRPPVSTPTPKPNIPMFYGAASPSPSPGE